jgi:uncharacterized protein YbaR (Trm112 family)
VISPELLQILCCPETKAPLTLATEHEIAEINQRIQKGDLQTVDEKKVSIPLEGGLIRNDRRILYRIQNKIPILLIQEGIRI